ncbi:MAG TPA: DNA/RNA non-specific endonuclease, partial [Burkholderiales bacterium]|nr:DNA/RNA non-specific endonuclease [Burkholderiales bacterium]
RGNITTAATFLENALGNSLPIAIGFLANQIGLGRISERIREILGGLQERVNGAIDWLIDRAIRLGQAVLDLARRGVSAARTAVSRLGAWAMQVLGLSKRFTTSNGEEHRLFFEEQGENVVLMVASDEKTYEDFLIHITVPANTPMATRKAEGIAKAREIDALIASRRRTSTDAATGVRDQTPEFTTKLNELSLITRDLMSDSTAGPLPVTPVPTYGGQQDGFGKRMSVTPLTTHGAPGTPVQVDNPTYRSLLKRKENPGGRSYYIAGHLLNNNVHGSGTTWDNLTPISQRTNQQHERDVESKVKDAVDDNAILEYTVDVDYTRNLARNNALIAEILRSASPSGALPPDLTIKKEVIEAEQKLPKQLVCTVRKIDAAGVEDASFADRRTQYPITNVVQEDTLDQYYIDGATFDPNAELAALTTEARAALSANATLLWSAFRTSNGGRIDRLQEANAALVDQLRLVFREHHRDRAYAAEAAAIPGLSELQTWTAYKGGRAIYDPSSDSAMTVTQISQLEQAFNTRRDNLRTQATSEKIVAAGGLSTEENWGSFRQRLSVYASDGALTEDQVTQVRTAFDARMAALRNATTTNP